ADGAGKAGDDEGNRRGQTQRAGADEHHHAQNFFGRVGDRRQRIRREDRETGDARQPFVMSEVGRDWLPDDKPFELVQQPFFGHSVLPTAGGVSWRARGWKSSTERLLRSASPR